MKTLSAMIDSPDQDRWFDFAKVLAPCVSVIFLINSYIKSYFKNQADERAAALKIMIKDVVDQSVMPDIEKLNKAIDRLSDAIHDIKINGK